jgi:CRP/FNR family transcriptional regulator, cyclic AMP receptor protein
LESLERLLAEHPFFADLAPEYLELMTGCARAARFEGGEFLFREGEPANAFYVVRRGRVAITTITPHEGAVTIKTVEEGEIVGWSWLIPPYTWHFAARALEPTVVIALDAECVRRKSEDDHEFGFQVMRRFAEVMASRLEATHLQLLNVYAHRR